MQKVPEKKIRFQTSDNYNSLSENENETWRAPHHGENESALGSQFLTNLNADGLGKRSKECQIIKYCHSQFNLVSKFANQSYFCTINTLQFPQGAPWVITLVIFLCKPLPDLALFWCVLPWRNFPGGLLYCNFHLGGQVRFLKGESPDIRPVRQSVCATIPLGSGSL